MALGASNLARGLGAVVAAARDGWGPELEVVAAFGAGRSYGMASSLVGRRLPGILECGIWPLLRSRPRLPTRALVTDVGNDILYHVPVPRVVEWLDETVARLGDVAQEVVMTGLPLERIRRLSPSAFLFFRSLFVPQCRLTQGQTLEASERVDDALRAIAERRGARFRPMRLEWYGLDPIHIPLGRARQTWREVLTDAPDGPRGRWAWDGVRLFLMKPEQRFWLGLEQRGAQPGLRLRSGPTVWCY